MAKFVIECPQCGTLNEASTFIFAKKIIECGNCHNEINVKTNRMTSRICPHCNNVFIYDQAKQRSKCPACHKEIEPGFGRIATFPCPECGCGIQVDENTKSITCPVCNHHIESVAKEISKSKLVSDTGISVIKYEGDNETFVWKHPIEDFNTGSVLIVHESQEAVFFMNGQALDSFGPGKHILETSNIPVLKKLHNLPAGQQSPFHAEIYFINKTVQMNMFWGTSDRIKFIEPITGAPIDIGASGEMSVQVTDGRKLIIKLVGTTGGISWDTKEGFTKSLRSCFRPLIQTVVKTNLASIIKAEKLDILDIDEHLGILSEALREKVSAGFDEFGLGVPQFYITGIALPDENDPNFKIIRQLHAKQLQKMKFEYDAEMEEGARQVKIEQKKTDVILDEYNIQKERNRAEFEAEKVRLNAQAVADATLVKGTAEANVQLQKGVADAEIMKAKGYDQKDVLHAEVQKAYAEGIGMMGSNGGSMAGGMMSEMVGLGVGLAAIDGVSGKVGGMVKGFTDAVNTTDSSANGGTWTCECGSVNKGKFCSECGKLKPEAWDCAVCGAKGNKGKFCSECGAPKPEAWDCPKCGFKGNKGKFCSECGAPRDSAPDTWDCSCGNKNISGKFCSECGKGKEG